MAVLLCVEVMATGQCTHNHAISSDIFTNCVMKAMVKVMAQFVAVYDRQGNYRVMGKSCSDMVDGDIEYFFLTR